MNWLTCGEIDIMENAANWGPQSDINTAPQSKGTANTNSASLHYPGRFGGNANKPPGGHFVQVSNNNIRTWHTYGIKYDQFHMQWYLDGQPMGGRMETPQTYKDRAQFFILNQAVGGILGGNQFDLGAYNGPNGQRMLVDYVRVWQLKADAITTTPATTTFSDSADCLQKTDCTFDGQTAGCQGRIDWVMQNTNNNTPAQAYEVVARDCPNSCAKCGSP